ncbi:GntR family transcriptional regulator [Gracilibacillus alcaliphilus]|uniref:GntR family transcriptional regulator n=1 Tax=Gracilibacillus alcaliphilus TaxID=1401441 RepID=UPI0019579367|nr:GntR family transcriptional regulator [Gracilibacillus alcaliphilus]MBM7676419.1 DNA-binding GntR family transcriptional regulator [Gracilibacillus alcaliphilus]
MISKNIRGSSRDHVYNSIRTQIMAGAIPPGEKLSEKEISEQFNVSRTPVREAFLKLSQEELLNIYPQIGSIVSKIDLKLVEEGRFVRKNIEKAVIKEVAEVINQEDLLQLETNLTLQNFSLEKGSYQRLFELDNEFHQLLYSACKKQRTWAMVQQMNIQFDRLRLLRLSVNHDWGIVVSQHHNIYQAIVDKEPILAEQAAIEHLNLVEFEINQLLEDHPNFFMV